jgi:hypothetical protein
MSIRSKVLAAAVALTVAGGAIGTLPASAATPECGPNCISIFSRAFGTYDQPNFVEAVLDGQAKVGQPLILKRASRFDSSEDLVPDQRLVSQWYAVGMVSAAVNRHYGDLQAAQIQYAPLGMLTGLCVGVEGVPSQGEGLTLQPCSAPGSTVWIVDTADSPATAPEGYFPLVNGATKNFSRPYAMDYPRGAHPTDCPTPHIQVRRLKFRGKERRVPDRQLWGTLLGVLPR